jgi:hypothetical protein
MSTFPQISCKVIVTVASSGNYTFFEKAEQILLLSSSVQFPVSVKKWLASGFESILSYSGIIVLCNNVINKESEEHLSDSMAHLISKISGIKESPLSSQKILLCSDIETEIISSFCDIYSLDVNTLTTSGFDISFWSILEQNEFYEMNR